MEYLPVNRDERYYTGTVLPMIICRENLKYFNTFLSLLPINTDPKVNWSKDNIQFFTEYSLRKSFYNISNMLMLSDEERKRFLTLPRSIPDILIYLKPQKVLIAVEAKMFDNVSLNKLKVQLEQQAEVLNFISDNLSVKELIHYSLLPKKLNKKFNFPDKVITWEDIYTKYKELLENSDRDYFLSELGNAIKAV